MSRNDPFPPVTTERLLLRCAEATDAAAIADLMTPGISGSVASWPPVITLEMAGERIENARIAATAGGAMPCVIVRRDDRALLGWIAVNRIADDATRGELGYWICEPFQGQGYATEAAAALIPAAFATLGIQTIQAGARVGNAASFSILEKLQMRAFDERMVYAPHRDRHELCRFYEISSGDTLPAD